MNLLLSISRVIALSPSGVCSHSTDNVYLKQNLYKINVLQNNTPDR